MNAFPTHRDLEHAVQFAQRTTRGDQHPSPHHWADVEQPYLDLHDLVSVRCGRCMVVSGHGRLARLLHLCSLPPVTGICPEHPTSPYALPYSSLPLHALLRFHDLEQRCQPCASLERTPRTYRLRLT